MMMQAIYHIVVWLLFHKVVQSCDIWPYMSDITNVALAMVRQGCLHLTDCHIVLGQRVKNFADLPLDDLLLKGCMNLI
jgi:hypothetical protein